MFLAKWNLKKIKCDLLRTKHSYGGWARTTQLGGGSFVGFSISKKEKHERKIVPSNKTRRIVAFYKKSFSRGLLRSSLWSSDAIVYIFLFSSFSRDETQCKVGYKNDLVFFARRSSSNRIMDGAGVNVTIFSLKYLNSAFQGRNITKHV